jgi:hypothetical protein
VLDLFSSMIKRIVSCPTVVRVHVLDGVVPFVDWASLLAVDQYGRRRWNLQAQLVFELADVRCVANTRHTIRWIPMSLVARHEIKQKPCHSLQLTFSSNVSILITGA